MERRAARRRDGEVLFPSSHSSVRKIEERSRVTCARVTSAGAHDLRASDGLFGTMRLGVVANSIAANETTGSCQTVQRLAASISESFSKGRDTMKQIRLRATDLSGPALVEGGLAYLCGASYVKQTVALCFLPSEGHLLGETIDQQAQGFRDIDVALLIVAAAANPLHRLWMGREDKPRTSVLADVGGRLRRAFRVSGVGTLSRCHTIVIDQTGVLRLRISHDFVEHDLAMLRKIIEASQRFACADSSTAACLSA